MIVLLEKKDFNIIMDKEREYILNELNKLWFNSSCGFRNELLNVMSKIENKQVKKDCPTCKKLT